MPRPLVAAMQQIADRLKKLDMTQYAQAFADNDIDFRRPDTFSGPLVYTFADGPMPTIMIMSRALAE
jgi:hypothetical protein